MRSRRVYALVAAALTAGPVLPAAASINQAPVAPRPHVVVATLDTGTNPFHPTFRRSEHRHPSAYIPGYPRSALPVPLSFRSTYEESVDASSQAVERFAESSRRLTYVPGTNLIGAWTAQGDTAPVFDDRGGAYKSHSHGAQASSQIAGRDFGLAPDAYLVVVDYESDGTGEDPYTVAARGLRWAADQPWIDIIHTNIQNVVPLASEQTPEFPGYADAVFYAMSKGKLVVSAGGNFYAETTETSPHAGPRGVLVAGANDNCGFSEYSNPNPHVVMDGDGTVSASPTGFGTKAFSGTSSASPRITGYAADLLLRLRRHYGITRGISSGALLTLPPTQRRPTQGPLADGALTPAELHEVIRKTANPSSHASKWDGTAGGTCIPQPVTGTAAYPKVGYGEVSEHTQGAAEAVLLGRRPLPPRPDADRYFAASERLRELFWEARPGAADSSR